MTIIYPVVFTALHDETDTYLIDIPDIQGVTEGYGLKDAIDMARDYIGCKLYDMPDESVPEASAIQDIDTSKTEFAEYGESFVSLVDLDLSEYRRKIDALPPLPIIE